MAPTMEQLGRRVAEWRASLLDKGLKVNAGKSKVIVGSSGGKIIVEYGVCGKGVQANHIQCTVCIKWIHKRCSCVLGDLSQVESFCYLGYTHDGDGGEDIATTDRIINGWMKFRELLPFLTSRGPLLEMKGRV